MTPRYFHPGEWLAAIDGLPRLPAILVLVTSLSMLVLGLRGFKYYIRLYVGFGGWVGGAILAKLMHVSSWTVALPTALIGIALVWPVSSYAAPVVIGFILGCGFGTLVANGLGLGGFWLAFAVGLFAGVSLTVLATRFTIALFCAACGTMAVVASLGAAVRASGGWLAPGGYVDFPVIYVILGAVLFVAAMIAQVALEPELPQTGE
ncbi:hypothetical protein ACFL6C_09840 [Myxococcota bacterium]